MLRKEWDIFRFEFNKHYKEEPLRLVVQSKSNVFMNLSTSFGKSVVFQALSIVYSYVEQQTRAKKTDALAGDSMCTAALLLAWELQT